MKTLKGRLLALTCAAGAAFAASSGTAYADAMTSPAMAGPLAANPNPYSIDLPDWLGDAAGKVYVTGAVTGLAFWQSSPIDFNPGDDASFLDLSNGQVIVQKTDGWLQFYAQFGAYSLPTVGVPYLKATSTVPATFGYVPVAYVKLQGEGDWSSFSFEAGKLPTLIGDEYTFTYENMNIERGLLWNLEPAISRGVQLNWSSGAWNASVSWNDGSYSNNLNWMSGLLSYGFNGGADTLAFAGGGNLGGHNGSLLNQGSVYNLIYTHTSGPWVISPYFQYITTPSTGGINSGSVWGGALLVTYGIDDNWKLSGRVEYETQSGHGINPADPNLLGYGAGSNAWSFTVTPTYQWKQLFARVDASYVSVGSGTAGDLFGSGPLTSGTNRDQVRLVLETGILF
jgi:hypothetical protein